ncbi:MAG: redoxin domain-containing protein [Thermoleophilaceae bacterium]
MLDRLHLSYTGNIPSLSGATEWLNSEPLTAADLEGRVVLFDFWTLTCINWIRTAPYRRAWYERYREHGLTIVGVHTPEFPFERDVDSIRTAIEERQIAYPVAVDSHYGVWDAFANRYWPALHFVDRAGTIRFQHFGEGRYEDSERMIQELLDLPADDVVVLETQGIEAQADWDSLASPETYLGAERGERFASPDGGAWDERRSYTTPSSLELNLWALAGEWTIGSKATTLHEADGRVAYRFRARDVNLVMGPAEGAPPVRFRVSIDGGPPGAARGVDVDGGGEGVAADRRLFQLVRQPERVDEHTFEITFLEPGVEVYAFTFG